VSEPFSGAHSHSLPSLSCALSRTPSLLSLALCAHPWSSHLVCRPFRGHRRASSASVALVSSASSLAMRNTLWFALASLFRSIRAHWPFHHAARAPSSSTQGLPASPSLLKRSRVPSRNEKLPHALNFSCTALLSAQLLPRANCAVVGLLHGPRPLVPLHRCRAHG
jgi:hypothetical protein